MVQFDETGAPRNPMGRTGMTGRGLLGKWGPNHAADPIVTRWEPLNPNPNRNPNPNASPHPNPHPNPNPHPHPNQVEDLKAKATE